MPSGLSASAKTAWKTLVEDLRDSGRLDSADWPLIEIAAVTIGRMREARRIVEREGLLAEGQRGAMTKHPAYLIERENAAEVRHLLEHLGVGPVGRARVTGGGPSKPQVKTMKEEFDSKVGPSARQKLRALEGGKK
jgi:P27 family predicted phage terminase small subunit